MVSGALCSALPSIAFAQTQKLAPEYDVIVIGSGFAGLAAAISAAENGAKVAVLDGGARNSHHAAGARRVAAGDLHFFQNGNFCSVFSRRNGSG